jgi:hypothetical protein
LWSHPRPFRKEKQPKEVCDLLVVLGDDVIIFSDKQCAYNVSRNDVAWKRWFKASVLKSAEQAWGAERMLRQHPHTIFADEACTRRLPVDLPAGPNARYHIVLTVHGVEAACRQRFGGFGSLTLDTRVTGRNQHTQPFVVGDLDPQRTFVHVFTEFTLNTIMSVLDTTPDFLTYLKEKERLCRGPGLVVQGEENLLAYFLQHSSHTGRWDRPQAARDGGPVLLNNTLWRAYKKSRSYPEKLKLDELSYIWDRVIGDMAERLQTGSDVVAYPEPAALELPLRVAASEPRLRRRGLAGPLADLLFAPPDGRIHFRIIRPTRDGEPMYVFVAVPSKPQQSFDERSRSRLAALVAWGLVARQEHPDVKHIVGISVEAGCPSDTFESELVYIDDRPWPPEFTEVVGYLQKEITALQEAKTNLIWVPGRLATSNSDEQRAVSTKRPRNSACFCGSGRKYKACHGR